MTSQRNQVAPDGMYSIMHVNRIGEVSSDHGEPKCQYSSLSFTALPKTGNDPVQMRRARFVAKLEEQKFLLKDPTHVRTVQRWAKVDGERQAVTKQQAVRPWWKAEPSGQVVMSVKFGARPIEFDRGKAGIVVPSKDRLPAVIDTLIAAVRAGELDDLFSQAAKSGSIGKTRKAAA